MGTSTEASSAGRMIPDGAAGRGRRQQQPWVLGLAGRVVHARGGTKAGFSALEVKRVDVHRNNAGDVLENGEDVPEIDRLGKGALIARKSIDQCPSRGSA